MKKIYKIAAIATPVTISVGSLATYFAVSMQDNVVVQKDEANDTVDSISLYDKYEVFPELNQETFYDDVKVVKGKGIIDEQMVSKILNYIFDHMEVAEGDIGWSVKKMNEDTCVIISVKWNAPDKVYSKNYKIDLKQINV